MRHQRLIRRGRIAIFVGLVTLLSTTPASLAAAPLALQHEAEIAAIAQALGISVEEAALRDELRQRAEPLYDAIDADPDNFGGIYSTDEGGRWRVVVRHVGDVPPSAVRAVAPPDVPVDWIQAQYSMAKLNAVSHELLGALEPQLKAKRVSQITPDEASNTVVVGLPEEIQSSRVH